jgi:two-component system sensor kinase FixL
VIEAVVRNAIDSMHGRADGELRIRLAGSRRGIRTTIRDTGDVIDDTAVRNIFVPYFTRRDHAIGLGMTMARTLVESHGGTIDAAPAQGGGCVVTIALPRKVL